MFSAQMWKARRGRFEPACVECVSSRRLALALSVAMERLVNESRLKQAKERAEQQRTTYAQYLAQLPEIKKRRREANRAVYRLRNAVLARDGYVCGICGEVVHEQDLSIDHIVPISAGGSDDIANLQPSHKVCNSRKGGESHAAQLLDLPASRSRGDR